MSWDLQSGAPSSEADPAAGGPGEADLAELARARGATLLDALEDHRRGSRAHAEATASYAFAAAVELGFEREHADAVRETARLHEVGMIYVPTAVLAAGPEQRSAEDAALIGAHPGYGAELALGAGVPQGICAWIRATAERFDGRGPAGLAGERRRSPPRRQPPALPSIAQRPSRPCARLRAGSSTRASSRPSPGYSTA